MNRGLTTQQARERAEQGLGNRVSIRPSLTEGQIILRHTLTFFNFIFIVLAVILVLAGSSIKNMTFLMVAFFNAAIGCVQQIRAKRAVDRLSLVAAQQVKVLRDGKMTLLRHDLLVQDDVVELTAGDQLCADGELLSGVLQVNEALLTGESDSVSKQPGEQLLSGSFVVAGQGLMRLTRVGDQAFAAKLAAEARKNPDAGKSEMMASLDKLIRVLGFALIPVGALLFYQEWQVLQLGLQKSAEATVAALVGMIPEGLYLLTSMALALSALKLTRQKVLVQDLSCIETLARVDVLCVDKTGTITAPEMEVTDWITLNGEEPARIRQVLGALFGQQEPDNETARAIHRAFPDAPDWQCLSFEPFSPETRFTAGVFRKGTFVIGAPEAVCARQIPQIEKYLQEGFRVLLLARCTAEPIDPARTTPMALVLLKNHLRPNAVETFAYFARQGVQIKVISGDDPVTASRVAAAAGIVGADRYVNAAGLQTREDFLHAAGHYTVFGRVSPGQKQQLILALKELGHTVAMTGDGVNDVLAMKSAHCGIAMAGGAQAASQVARMVLLDGDFAAMPGIVGEGRRVINNIQRSAALFLVKNILSFGLSLLTIFTDQPYPFAPFHLTLVGALTIGVPSFFLALEPNYDRVQGKFLPTVLRQALPGGLTNVFSVLLAQQVASALGFSLPDTQTLCTAVFAFVGLLVLHKLCRPFGLFRAVLWGVLAGALVFCFLVLPGFFQLHLTRQEGLLVLLVLMAAAAAMFLLLQFAFRLLDRVWRR